MILLEGYYNKWIVLLSFVIAAVASYSALNLASKISGRRGDSPCDYCDGHSIGVGTGRRRCRERRPDSVLRTSGCNIMQGFY
ncbi:MHYT domain-containing protein [Brevibacillus massiliensis]|uniref:MHYT domain-containing protein n=1 Tax=Brevibacillus massiliensis TaxID=1118054 RepID=UPI00315C740E